MIEKVVLENGRMYYYGSFYPLPLKYFNIFTYYNKQMALRFDLVLSYWIFAWYLLYITQVITYSPKLIIILGIIENMIVLLLMFYYGSNITTITYFIVVNLFIKIIPFYTLRNEKIQLREIKGTFVFLLVYLTWVYTNGQSVITYYKNILESLIHNKNETPFIALITKIKSSLKNKYRNK